MEMAEETKKLQVCWLHLKDDFKAVYKLVLEGAYYDSNRPKPDLLAMAESVHKLVYRDPHQLYQRLEAQLREFVLELKGNLVTLLQKQAKNPRLAQDFIQGLLGGHEKLCEACKLLSPVLSDLEVNHLRRFSLTWELLSKHLYQLIVYTDPLIQNNLPIFVSQLRALYPAKESEERYTELVRGYLDFDVEMENVGVFWSGAEALLFEYTSEQERLREKQKMLKNDWERFKLQRKQIETTLLEKPPVAGAGEKLGDCSGSVSLSGSGSSSVSPSSELAADTPDNQQASLLAERRGELQKAPAQACECHVCTAPCPEGVGEREKGGEDSTLPLFPPPQAGVGGAPSSLYPHLYNLPPVSSSSAVASLSQAFASVSLSQAGSGSLPTTTTSSTGSGPPQPSPRPSSLPLAAAPPPSATTSATSSSATSEQVVSGQPAKPNKPSLQRSSSGCSHKHKNANAKELKKLMGGHDCQKPGGKGGSGTRKSKSSSAIPGSGQDRGGESTEEMSGSDSSPEPESCASSASGDKNGDKHCACCYCEVFGHGGSGGGGGAPVSRNYPEMRERLRLLLSKKKRKEGGNRQQQQQQHPHPPPQQPQKQQPPQQPPQQAQVPKPSKPAAEVQAQAQQVKRNPPPPQAPSPAVRQQQQAPGLSQQQLQQQQQRQLQEQQHEAQMQRQQQLQLQQQQQQQQQAGQAQDLLARKDVDEIIDYIEGNKTFSTNDKKRQKKERQKQQRLEELRAKQEEERKRKAAEEASRKAREEEERMRREFEEKAAKKSKKKAAQKAKKLAAAASEVSTLITDGGNAGLRATSEIPDATTPEGMLDLEKLRMKHIREQKDLLEKQKQQLIEQQKKLDEQLTIKLQESSAANAAVSAAEAAKATMSKKAAKRAAKAASSKTTYTLNNASQPHPSTASPAQHGLTAGVAGGYPGPPAYMAPPYQAQPHPGAQNYGAFQPQPQAQQFYPSSGGYGQSNPSPGGYGQSMPAAYPPYPAQVGAQPQPSGFAPFSNPYMPVPPPPKPQPSAQSQPPTQPPKSDQPMVTIKRVMRPDTGEPTVTISVKKDSAADDSAKKAGGGQQQTEDKEKVLFTLVNGQVMKTADAPDNLIPSAKPLPKELAKRLLPEEAPALSKKQRKKLRAKNLEEQQSSSSSSSVNGSSRAPPPLPSSSTPANVDLDKLRLPEGVSISKINGPVPERRYFPCKTGPESAGGPAAPTSNSWGQHPAQPGAYPGTPVPGYPGSQHNYGPGPGMPGRGAPNSNVIVVDTNNMEQGGQEKTSKKKKKKNKNSSEPQPSSQPGQAWGPSPGTGIQAPPQHQPAHPGAMLGMQPQPSYGAQPHPQVAASSSAKPKEWTPAQYGGYVPPSDGKGGGQVLIKSVNGKVVITPVPGTGATVSTTTLSQASAARKVTTPAATEPGSNGSSTTPSSVRPSSSGGSTAPGVPGTKKPLAPSMTKSNGGGKAAPLVNGVGGGGDHSVLNGKVGNANNIENQAPSDDLNVNGGSHLTEEEGRKNKKNKKKRNPDEKLEELNSIFDPRDCGDVDAADREIEQFKQFCRDSVPVQNRAKVNFDVRNIAFKKK